MRRSSHHRHSLAFAVLATFGFVLELLIVEEQLFTRCEHEFRATIDALQNLILVFHLERRSHFASLLCTGDPNREGSGSQRGQESYIPLMHAYPLDSARHAVCTAWLLLDS